MPPKAKAPAVVADAPQAAPAAAIEVKFYSPFLGLQIWMNGQPAARFVDGQFATTDPELAALLRTMPEFVAERQG